MKCPNCHVNDLEPIMMENIGMGFGVPDPQSNLLKFHNEPNITHVAITIEDDTHDKRTYGLYECSNCDFVSIKRIKNNGNSKTR